METTIFGKDEVTTKWAYVYVNQKIILIAHFT
jgi:hypothetical protein